MKRKLSAATFFATVMVLAFAASAGAVDGTIEINQAKVMAAGGFPFVISTANTSYRLTGSLTVSTINTSGISVTASNVTIDLNGFSISGSDGLDSSKAAIAGLSAGGLTVENGTVTGFGGVGIETGSDGIVRNVRATGNPVGIECGGSGCLISGNTLFNNGTGIVANDTSTGYGGNVLKNSITNVSGGTSLGNNLCSGVVC